MCHRYKAAKQALFGALFLVGAVIAPATGGVSPAQAFSIKCDHFGNYVLCDGKVYIDAFKAARNNTAIREEYSRIAGISQRAAQHCYDSLPLPRDMKVEDRLASMKTDRFKKCLTERFQTDSEYDFNMAIIWPLVETIIDQEIEKLSQQ